VGVVLRRKLGGGDCCQARVAVVLERFLLRYVNQSRSCRGRGEGVLVSISVSALRGAGAAFDARLFRE